MTKEFKLSADQITPGLAPNTPAIATDRIVVDGARVAFMYRDGDGWNFFAGDETQEYVDDPANLGLYSLNTIANYDRSILAYLDAPPGSAWIRESDGFIEDPLGAPHDPDDAMPPNLNPDYPVVEGPHAISQDWSVFLPEPMNRRVDDGSLVLWRPGLTAWISVWGNDHADSPEHRRDLFKSRADPRAYDRTEWSSGGVLYCTYRLADSSPDKRLPALYGFAIGGSGHAQLALYFDSGDDLTSAQLLMRSVSAR